MNGHLRFIGWVTVAAMLVGYWGSGRVFAAEVDAGTTSNTGTERIGVYDSRSVAVAFAGSAKHEERAKAELDALAAAKESGNQADIEKADKHVWDSRKRLHRQGFGAAPVDDILALYPDAVKALKEEHQLAALVSKWDKKSLKQYAAAEKIDVTLEMIEIPGPNDRQRKSAIAIMDHKPVSDASLERLFKKEGH